MSNRKFPKIVWFCKKDDDTHKLNEVFIDFLELGKMAGKYLCARDSMFSCGRYIYLRKRWIYITHF